MFRVLISILVISICWFANVSLATNPVVDGAELEVILFRERIDGDELLYIDSVTTDFSFNFTEHSIEFEWVGVEDVYTQIVIEVTGGYNSAILLGPPDNHSWSNRYFQLGVANFMAQEITVNMYVFGFTRQPQLPPLNFTEDNDGGGDLKNIPMEIKIHYINE